MLDREHSTRGCRAVNARGIGSVEACRGEEPIRGRARTMKALASAIVAAAILIVGADGLGHAWASPAAAQIKARAWGGRGAGRPGWGPRAGWRGPGVVGRARACGGAGRVRFRLGCRVPGGALAGTATRRIPTRTLAPYAYPPAVVVQPSPQVYIEQSPAPAVAAPPAGRGPAARRRTTGTTAPSRGPTTRMSASARRDG